MAAEHLKSALVTNATAVPLVLSNANVGQGLLRECVGAITPAAAAEANSTYRFCRVPSNARISQILVTCAAFTTAGAVHIGVYQTAENAGTVVDADYFASAIALTGALNDANYVNESTTNTPAKQEQMLWQALGLSADSNREYDIAMTVSTQFDGGQAMVMKVRYTL